VLAAVEEALCKTIELDVLQGVTETRKAVVTPVAVQLATEVELAAVFGKSTVQVPANILAIEVPPPILRLVVLAAV